VSGRHRISAVVLTAAVAMLAACSDSKTIGSSTTVSPATSDSLSPTVPVTDAVTTTGDASTTTVAITSTTVAAATALVLRDSGIGSFTLGAAAASVVDGISVQLGDPTRDDAADYPVADGLGAYTSTDGEIGFIAPMGRSVCWSINLCAYFGGASTASMSFTGWTYVNDPTSALSSVSGGTVGARWSELPTMDVDAGGCYSTGSGAIDGVRVALESTGDPFGAFDDAGNYIATLPARGDVKIISMETGKTPIFLYGDC